MPRSKPSTPTNPLWQRVETGEISALSALKAMNTPAPQKQAAGGAAKETPRPLSEIMQELDGLVGLHEIKDLVREIHALVEIQRRRAAVGLKGDAHTLHMVFRGNPGTGKTTVARLLAESLRAIGVLSKGHLIEAERADLVGEYIGHTAQKTREQIRRAQGGVLFIDEAYALARGGEKDFGKEAIDTLVKSMEDMGHHMVLVLAGYRQEMEHFLRANPGLRSRFPIQVDFPDYTASELLQIAELMVHERDYQLSAAARRLLADQLDRICRQGASSRGNARTVRNWVEQAIRRHAVRLMPRPGASRDELRTIEWEDLLATLPKRSPRQGRDSDGAALF